MVSLGHFTFNNPLSSIGDADQQYDFRSRTTLFSSARFHNFHLRMKAVLEVKHNTEGGVNLLEIRLEHYTPEYGSSDGYVGTCDESQFAYVLSYLAGIHHLARESALETIENWHVEAMDPIE